MMYYPQQQQMYNNNMVGMYSIPTNPIGYGYNMTPLGYGGYNGYPSVGGYYTGYYANNNPYNYYQQMETYNAQLREQQRQQNDLYIRLYKSACSYTGEEPNQEFLDSFEPQKEEDISDLTPEEQQTYINLKRREIYLQQQQTQINWLMENYGLIPYYNQTAAAYANAYQKIFDDYRKQVPANIGLVEYMDKYAGKDYIAAQERKMKEKQSDLKKLYNHGDYNKLLQMHKNAMFGNVFNPNASIDDQEVHLPGMISDKTKQERRAAFMQALLNKGGL